jgi:Xaa-Pro aminopeptidase
VVVSEPEDIGGDRPMLAFETITLVPIDLNLVEPSLLTETEKGWLNLYHARVRDVISPLVDDETRAWLDRATRAI